MICWQNNIQESTYISTKKLLSQQNIQYFVDTYMHMLVKHDQYLENIIFIFLQHNKSKDTSCIKWREQKKQLFLRL